MSSIADTRRLRARPWGRMAAYALLAAAVVTCDSPTSMGRVGTVALAPSFAPSVSQVQFAGLVVDQARITIVRPPSDTLARRSFSFAPGDTALAARVDVSVRGTGEDLDAFIELLAGGAVVFSGTQPVHVVPGPPATGTPPVEIPVSYVGPGTQIAALAIDPPTAALLFGGQQQFTVTATDSQQQAVASFYAGWRSSDPAHVVDAQGRLTAGTVRGAFWVFAQTPTGVRDSVRVMVSPVANAIAAFSGDGQTGTIGLALAQPLVARVSAADGGPVAGVDVAFSVLTGGGSVTTATVATDTLGLAATTVTLGALAGAQTFRASAGSAGQVTFTVTATGATPAIMLSLPGGNLLALGGTDLLEVHLAQPAPAGGVVVTVTSDSTNTVSVAAPGTVTIAAGDSTGSIDVNGVGLGQTFLRASAPGYTAAQLLVAVTPNILTVSAASVAVGDSTTVTITAFPTPAFDVPITVTSTDSAIARVTTPAVTIVGGQPTTTARVLGVAAGSAGILANAATYVQGGNVVTVTAGGVPTAITKTAGDGLTAFINDTTAVRPQVTVLDALSAPVPGVQVLFTIATGGGTIAGSSATAAVTDAAGVATAPGPWAMGPAAGSNTLDASLPLFPGVTAQTFTATGVLPPPQIVLSIFGSNVVGQGRSGLLNVRLLQAAPVGGLAVTLTTTRSGLLYIGSYLSETGGAAFAQGDTLQPVTVYGDSSATGADTIIASAPGYTPDTLAVPVSLNLISLPPTLNVPLSQSVSLPINLSVAAPAGGVKVAVASADPGIVQVVTDTVTIAQGSQVGNAQVLGASLGSVALTATNPNYAPDVTTVNVTASLNVTQATIAPNASFGVPITIQLESSGSPIAAPAGGIPVTLTPRNPACAAAPNTTIPSGLVSASVAVTYGGSATLPCSTYVVASGPAGFATDSVLVNMAVQPAMAVSATYLGSGLQRAVTASLGASNHGGTTVRLTSTDPSVLLIAPNDSTPGSAFIDVPVGVGGTSFTYYIQALDGITGDTSFVAASAPGFVPDTAQISVYQAVFDIIFLNASGNTRSVSDPFQVRTGSASLPTGAMGTEDEIRAGGVARTFSIVNDSAAVGDLVTTSLTADSVTVQIGPRLARSATTVATGGVEFDYVAGGVTNVRASSDGGFFRPVGAALGQTVTVTAPTVSIASTYIGARLQRAVSGSLSAAAVAGDTVTLATAQPGILRISPDDSTSFADTIRIGLSAGATSFTYYIQGVDSIVADTVDVTASMPAYTGTTAAFRVYQAVFDLIFLNGTGNTRSASDPFQVRTGSVSTPTGTAVSTEDELRFGHPALTFSVVNDSALVGDLVTQALTGDSVTVQVAPRLARSPSTVATGGVEFDYTAGGVTNVRASSFGNLVRPAGAALGQAVTVSAPTVSISSTYIGARLQRAVTGSLSAAAVAGDTVTLAVAQPGILRISPDDSTGFADTIRIALAAGATSFTWYIQGVDSIIADTVDVTAAIPAYTGNTATIRVYQPVYDIIFLNATANALAANDPFQVRLASPASPTGGVSVEDELRFGHPTLDASIRSLQATVAQLVTQTLVGDSVTVPIAPRQSRSPGTVATGGVELDYLSTDTTIVIASIPLFRALATDTQTVVVTAPTTTLGVSTVGAGLQESASGSLSSGNHGGINVIVTSSNPAVALVSPNSTTPGTDSIVIPVAAGGTSFSYYVQGVEGATGGVTIRAAAPGFTDGTATATIVQPAVDIIFLASTGSVATSVDDPFQARVGRSNLPTNSSMSVEQEVRAGAPGPLTVTITTTNPAAGLLNTTALTGQSQVTLTIPVGQARTPSSLALGGVTFDFVAPGVTFVVPGITGFVTVQQTSPFTQPGLQVTVGP